MEAIDLTDDELTLLEKRFGAKVRQMGQWNSDGTFGYTSIPIIAVERAAEAIGNPQLMLAFFHLEGTPERTKAFIDLLETFGTDLIERIVTVYRECSLLELISSKPAKLETRSVTGKAAAG